MINKIKLTITALVLMLGLAFMPIMVEAASVTYALDFTFSGYSPSGSLMVTFTDNGSGGVSMKMDASNLSGSEIVDDVYFNFGGNAKSLKFAYNGTTGPQANKIFLGSDSFKADGVGGYFDGYLDFPPPPGKPSAKFGAGEVVVYDIKSGDGKISIADFGFTSALNKPGIGGYYLATHIQGITTIQAFSTKGDNSGWVGSQGPTPTPEPSTVLLLGIGLIGIGLYSRRGIKK